MLAVENSSRADRVSQQSPLPPPGGSASTFGVHPSRCFVHTCTLCKLFYLLIYSFSQPPGPRFPISSSSSLCWCLTGSVNELTTLNRLRPLVPYPARALWNHSPYGHSQRPGHRTWMGWFPGHEKRAKVHFPFWEKELLMGMSVEDPRSKVGSPTPVLPVHGHRAQ